MNLDKELYELTGWDKTLHHYYTNTGDWSNAYLTRSLAYQDSESDKSCPYYDTDYLLEKLSHWHLEMKHNTTGEWNYKLFYNSMKDFYQSTANTNREALLRLAIELSKKGVV